MTGTVQNVQIKSKLPGVKTSIFAVMSGLAQEHGALNLSQGFPDFNCDDALIDRVHHYMKKGYNQYAPMPGVPALREAIAAKIKHVYGNKMDAEREITVTAGATQAIYAAITAVVNPEEEVIVFVPAYDCYAPAIKLNGGIPSYIELEPPHYRINWEAVKRRISNRTRMIIINTPHNPTGTILHEADLKALEHITSNTDIVVLSDEVYEHIIFDGAAHHSVLRYPELAARSFAIFSFGKLFHNTGWKMGYCVAPEHLMETFRKVHQYMVYCCNTPVQHGLADFLQDPVHYEGLSGFYQKKRDMFLRHLQASNFHFEPAGGTYFQLLDYRDITDRSDIEFAREMTKDSGVAPIPTSPFYHRNIADPDLEPTPKMLRFCFAKADETLKKAAEKLCQL